MARLKLTEAQRKALKRVEKRDWPAGEPRIGWLHKSTAENLLSRGLIVEREGTGTLSTVPWRTPIVDLTDAGREALSSDTDTRP